MKFLKNGLIPYCLFLSEGHHRLHPTSVKWLLGHSYWLLGHGMYGGTLHYIMLKLGFKSIDTQYIREVGAVNWKKEGRQLGSH